MWLRVLVFKRGGLVQDTEHTHTHTRAQYLLTATFASGPGGFLLISRAQYGLPAESLSCHSSRFEAPPQFPILASIIALIL